MIESVTVIIVGYNGDRWLPTCLTSLEHASAQRLRVVLVDNHNNPCIPTLDPEPFDTEVLKTPHAMGFAEANNYALLNSGFCSDLTVFLNQDTVSQSGWIDAVRKAFDADERIGVMCPALRTYDLEEWEPNLLTCLRDSRIAATQLNEPNAVLYGLQYVTGSAMVIRNTVLQEVGPFDPVFGSYYEDFDLCRRVRAAGYEIAVCCAATVGHFQGSVSTDPTERKRREATLIRNRLIYAVRDCAGSRIPLLTRHFLLTLPRSLVRGLLKTPSSQSVSSTLSAHLDLLKLCRRLIWKSIDEAAWLKFLNSINWNAPEQRCS